MEEFLPVIASSRLFAGILPEKIPELLRGMQARPVTYGDGGQILTAGSPVTALGLVLAGWVLVMREDFWGNRNLIAAMGPGQCFAETFACTQGAAPGISAAAEGECTVLFLNVRALFEEEPKNEGARLMRNLLEDIARKNMALTEKLSHVGQRTTRAKLLSYLSAESQRHRSVEFDIPFSRQQLADYLFVERSGLSAELGKMRDEGLLEFHRNHFVLKPSPAFGEL